MNEGLWCTCPVLPGRGIVPQPDCPVHRPGALADQVAKCPECATMARDLRDVAIKIAVKYGNMNADSVMMEQCADMHQYGDEHWKYKCNYARDRAAGVYKGGARVTRTGDT